MKTIILFYSYTGNCRKEVSKLKDEYQDADIYEVKDKRHMSMFFTVILKCPKAALRRKTTLKDITADLNSYDNIILVAPIWNGYPAPEFNTLVQKLPKGKNVELYLCSGSGDSEKSKAGTCELIEKAGCKIINYHDIKTTGMIHN